MFLGLLSFATTAHSPFYECDIQDGQMTILFTRPMSENCHALHVQGTGITFYWNSIGPNCTIDMEDYSSPATGYLEADEVARALFDAFRNGGHFKKTRELRVAMKELREVVKQLDPNSAQSLGAQLKRLVPKRQFRST